MKRKEDSHARQNNTLSTTVIGGRGGAKPPEPFETQRKPSSTLAAQGRASELLTTVQRANPEPQLHGNDPFPPG